MKTAVTQTETLRAMTMEQRWRVAQDLFATAREWKACALRSLHPEWTVDDIRQAVRRSFLYYKEGRSEKHLLDIRGMLNVSCDLIDMDKLDTLVRERNLATEWQKSKEMRL